MRKTLALMLAFGLVAGLAACGDPEPEPTQPVIEPEPTYSKY
jgi:hypothetical protein